MQLNIAHLKRWFIAQKRDLPWRKGGDPYAVWVSEVMLQQTQVAVVIPYFLRWMELFPSIESLAKAPADKVLKAWEGLGYYSRARNLHEGANYLVKHHAGCLPEDEKALSKIKGLGPYTVGAILSFAFHRKKGAVDGNVVRVLSRHFALECDVSKPSSMQFMRDLVETLLPDQEPWVVMEALIELGAVICQKKARCGQCPVSGSCLAYRQGKIDSFPFNSKKTTIEKLYRSVPVIRCQEHFLVKKGEKGRVMSDLIEFPYFEEKKGDFCRKELKQKAQERFALQLVEEKVLEQEVHGFTRYQARLYPALYSANAIVETEGYQWLHSDQLKCLAFSSGHKRILEQVFRWLQQV